MKWNSIQPQVCTSQPPNVHARGVGFVHGHNLALSSSGSFRLVGEEGHASNGDRDGNRRPEMC